MAAKKIFNGSPVPAGGLIKIKNGKLVVPTRPVIPYIEGDGIGAEIWAATRKVVDAAIKHVYKGKRSIVWYEVFAGDKAMSRFGEALPADTLAALKHFRVAIKGPLGTPTGGGMRSLNVTMRQELDLNQCIRPVRYYAGVPSVVKNPEQVNIVIFRQNTEDVYAGIEFKSGSPNALAVIEFLLQLGAKIRENSGIGIKPISRHESRRIVRSAIAYAIKHKRGSVTMVHKGNIQKFTEGSFRDWGYELAREEFPNVVITETELWSKYQGNRPEGKIVLKDIIADNAFCELLLRPNRLDVIVTTNLNGDYLSDAAAAQVGGLGMAPGANIGDDYAIFEATHGTAPDIAGKGLANPTSLLLSAVMMLEHLGWKHAAWEIQNAIEVTISSRNVTHDLARLIQEPCVKDLIIPLHGAIEIINGYRSANEEEKAQAQAALNHIKTALGILSKLPTRKRDIPSLSTSAFADAIIDNIGN